MKNRYLPRLLAAALVLASATSARAAAIDLPNDELLCYQAKQTKVLPKFTGVEISTKDQFEPLARRNYLAAKFVSFCNPQNPIVNSEVHYVGLSLKESKVNVNASKYAPPATVYNLADRLGMVASPGVTISKPKELFVRVAKTRYGNALVKCGANPDCAANGTATECNLTGGICVNPGAPTPADPTDLKNTRDYMCYAIKGPKLTFPTQANLSDQFGYTQSYLPNKITKVCAPTDKDMPNLAGPAPTFPGHLICYQAKSTKTNPAKFTPQVVAVGSSMIDNILEAKKVTDLCIPALKAADPGMPALGIPTAMTAITSDIGGTCGTVAATTGGVPNRLNPATGTNANSTCTAAGAPLPCCEGLGTGHCDERNTLTCGTISIGGGGPAVLTSVPELPQDAGQGRRFSLACASATDPACAVSGNVGDLPNGVNCTTAGCGFLPPLDQVLTSPLPLKICAAITLLAGPSGSLNLSTGAASLTLPAGVNLYAGTITSDPTAGCPRCRTTTSTASAEVFATGGIPGVGVCDTDSAAGSVGDTCYVFSPAGASAGLSTECIPVAAIPLPPIPVTLVASTTGNTLTNGAGNFCAGQGGNLQCTGSMTPNPCCTGVGTGTCNNFNGCFGSANATGLKFADIDGICTSIVTTGQVAGTLIDGFDAENSTIAGVACAPAVSAGGFSSLINDAIGLPSPIAFTVNNDLTVD